MPLPYLEKISVKQNIPLKTLEGYWERAKSSSDDPENYAIITTIFKKILKKHSPKSPKSPKSLKETFTQLFTSFL